jgi:spermidine synthase
MARPGEPAAEPPWLVPILAAAFLLSGSAGLIHEVVWARLLGLVFGATSLAISTVLAAFMAGLALGSYWIGVRADRFRDQRRVYALLEIGIGAFALLVPVLLMLLEPVYGWLWRRFGFSFTVFSVLRFILAGVVLLVPTVMMGATFPVLADYLARAGRRRLPPQWLYTLNLAGAVLGAAAAGYVLVPVVGVRGTIVIAAALNAAVGVAVLLLPRSAAVPRASADPSPSSERDHRPRAILVVAALLSGLLSLATQVAWARVLSLIVGSTTYAFTSVLVVYLVALGAGSAWASRRGQRAGTLAAELCLMHALLALSMLAAVYCVNRLPLWYVRLVGWWEPTTLSGVVAVKALLIFAVLAVPVVCAGTILPLVLIGALPPRARGTGAAVGRIYAVNTVGSIAGSFLAGFLFLPVLGSRATLLGVSIAAVLMAVAFALAGGSRWSRIVAAATTAVVGAGIVMQPSWDHLALHAGVFEPTRVRGDATTSVTLAGERALFHAEGPTSSVLVWEDTEGSYSMSINGRVNASDTPRDMATQVLLAQLPLLLAPRTEDVFIVGWGSGVTAGAATLSTARSITAVEIDPVVVDASRYFEHVNHEPLADARMRLYEDDARHILLASTDTYDVVISEPSHLWVTGVANLFTQDFYRIVERRLRPGGVFVQWLHIYRTSIDAFQSIVATVHSVFPQVLVFEVPNTFDLILMGSREAPVFDLAELERRWAHDGVAADMVRIGIGGPIQLLGAFQAGPDVVAALARRGRINTDDNGYVEFRAPRDMALESSDTGHVISRVLGRLATPVERLLRDPGELMGSPVRLEALVAGLEHAGRTEMAARYREHLARIAHRGS